MAVNFIKNSSVLLEYVRNPFNEKVQPNILGLLIFCQLTLLALGLSMAIGFSAALIVLLLGLSFNFVLGYSQDTLVSSTLQPAGNFIYKTLLRIGIALLGFRLALGDITSLGLIPVFLSAAIIGFTLLLGYFLGKKLGLHSHFAIIASGATAICGASAALAISSIVPASKKLDEDVALAVMIVTLLSSLAMVTYPLLAHLSGFNSEQAGLLFGATIHDVAQVVGAGLLFGEGAEQTATYSKMIRVVMLAPVVLIIALMVGSSTSEKTKQSETSFIGVAYNLIPPQFILFFIGFMILNSFIALPEWFLSSANFLSKFILLMALMVIAFNVNLKNLFKVGIAPFTLIAVNTVFVFTLAYTIIYLVY